MNQYPVFPNAPITEAVLDIRAKLPQEINLKNIESFHDCVKENFPEKKARMFSKIELKLSTTSWPTTVPASGGIDGYLFQSSKEKKIVQSRLDGFSFNKLRPYERWELFSSQARQLWDLYFRIVNPIKITKIALRYINRIEVPLPLKDLKEYILITPEISPNLPLTLSHFFMQLRLPKPEIEAQAIVTQTMENPTQDEKLPLILDIDVYHEVNYSGSDAKMWEDFEKLHLFKNEIFFNSITEKTKELFK